MLHRNLPWGIFYGFFSLTNIIGYTKIPLMLIENLSSAKDGIPEGQITTVKERLETLARQTGADRRRAGEPHETGVDYTPNADRNNLENTGYAIKLVLTTLVYGGSVAGA